MNDLFERVQSFIDDDPEPSDLAARLAAASSGDSAARADLEDRFQGPLKFGTAGLRGLMGPGQHRMNRATVLRATDGLVRYLTQNEPDAAERGLVVGRDGRHGSDVFQRDVVSVAVAHGMKVYWLDGPQPTPLAAYAVTALGAAAAVMVTASHNPPAYNGYKVFWGNGAQLLAPHDRRIARAIDEAPGAKRVPSAPYVVGVGLVRDVSYLADAYVRALAALHFAPDVDGGRLRVAYSALHGVGQRLFRRALRQRGIEQLSCVAEQGEPDGDFPTVAFPNPEEPGALDLVLELAERERADLVLVHDPDADRLGAAVRVDGRYRVLTGNEIGVLLAHHILEHTHGDDRLVVTTLVSSRQLSRMARDHGIASAETLTGFKWIADEGLRLEAAGRRFVFGYEEALGYCCGTVVRDKDGISAGLVLAEMAAEYLGRGLTLVDALREIRERHGVFAAESKSVTLADEPRRIGEAMRRLRATTATSLAGMPIETRRDFAASADERQRANMLLFELGGGGRVAVRPSGTEPKIKFYLEVAMDGGEVETALQTGLAQLDRLFAAVRAEAGL